MFTPELCQISNRFADLRLQELIADWPQHEREQLTAEKLNEVAWCIQLSRPLTAITEYRLWDGTRVDLKNAKYAFEVDWAKKWPEAFGQAVWYALETELSPAVILLTDSIERDSAFIYRAKAVGAHLKVNVGIADITKGKLDFGYLKLDFKVQ